MSESPLAHKNTPPVAVSAATGLGTPAEVDAATLLSRMREGDREAASAFVSRFGDLIRRRVRGKLGTGMRRVFDSQEILSTVSRRLDRYVMDKHLHAVSEPQLWSLLFRMIDAALVDKARAYRRLRHVEGEDSEFASAFLNRMNERDRASSEGGEIELEAAFRSLKSDVDREILAMWLNDHTHVRIAEEIESTPEAVRQRWRSIREHLRTQVLSGAL
jgi:DNA-directed RNA polymerase specialized sigma24 family protein